MTPTRRRLVSGALFGLLVLVGLAMPGPYVVEKAGPAIDVAGEYEGAELVRITGGQTYDSRTKYFMTTVSSFGKAEMGVTGVQALASAFMRDAQVLPVRAIYSKEQTDEQVDRHNAALMTESQDAAAVTALGAAGRKVTMKIAVVDVPAGSPAEGRLAKGDVLVSVAVGGTTTAIATYSDLSGVLAATPPGSTVTLGVVRDGQARQVGIATASHEADETGDVRPGSRLGVHLSTSDLNYPVRIEYGVKGIGGPSAGMMFALSIYDRLTPGALGGDEVIAGTGTISLSGEVGKIGGIQHKLVGASERGAKYFLAPAGNCRETVGYEPDGMEIYAVRTFDEAVAAVRAIGQGKTDGLTTCSAMAGR